MQRMRKGQAITFDGVRFEGSTSIHNPQRVIEALMNGIGLGKAYGYGLL